ncbi:hypothetical protein L1987_46424 [Smallanthus sonchifolius]|uniref:Uncharacterized protein n=1 Tax=Smallanthus sonchifolius TaxID=185202 RepID=A0ACB9G0B6_9ASTR|nr:hypothetical protein L1987_46424 [Smallanthus sonchifolius]
MHTLLPTKDKKSTKLGTKRAAKLTTKTKPLLTHKLYILSQNIPQKLHKLESVDGFEFPTGVDEQHYAVVGEVANDENCEGSGDVSGAFEGVGEARTLAPTLAMKRLAKVLNWEDRCEDFESRRGDISRERLRT